MILTKENINSIDVDFIVNGKIKSGKAEELLIIVPTNRKLRHLKKELISLIPGGTTSTINIETIGTLAQKILEQNSNFILLSEAAESVFIRQSAVETELQYFTNYKNEIPRGTLDKIKNVISEYKKHGITSDLLKIEAEKLNLSEKLKAVDIANIYELYNKKCAELNAVEIGDIYSALNNLPEKEFVKFFNKLFPKVNFVLIIGFDEFTLPEINIINSVSKIEEAKLFLNFDYYLYNPLVFSHLDKSYELLEAKGFNKIEDGSAGAQNDFKKEVRTKLSLNKQNTKENKFKEKVTKISAVNRINEIELIAKEIKNLINNENVSPHNICVVFNLISNYSAIVNDIFKVYGIPFNLTDRTPLSNTYPVTTIINFLEIIENNYYYKNILRALESGFIETKEIDTSLLLKTAAELKIVIGKDNWINTISSQIERIQNSHFDDETSSHDKIQKYESALESFKNLTKILEPFNNENTIPQFLELLKKFVFDIKLPEKILENSLGEEEKNIKAVTVFFETVEEIFNLLQKEYGKEEKFKLHFFISQIKTAVNWARFNIKEKPDYGVLVTSVNEIRGLQFDYLFISGLVDGDFPTRYSPEIFFSGSFAKQENAHYIKERYHFYQSLCSCDKKLFLTTPQLEKNKELSESTFLKDFLDLFEVNVKTENDYQNLIYSKEEVLNYMGGRGIRNFVNEFPEFKDKLYFQLESIIHKIEIDKLRTTDPFSDSVFNGYLNGESGDDIYSLNNSAKEKLNEFAGRQYSISQLETYAKCPYKFFTERILKLETVEEPTEEIEALELGSLIHSVLYEFYTKIRNEKIILSNCSEAVFRKAEKLIFEIAEKEIEKYQFASPIAFYEREKLFGLNGEKKESVLYKFLENERESDNQFTPAFFEVSFGKVHKSESDGILTTEIPIEIGGAKLRGKIDRVEVDSANNQFQIVDYKLGGKKITEDELYNGLALQLPVYMLAAKELLSKHFEKNFEPAGMFIYSLKYQSGDFGKKEISLTRKKTDDVIDLNNNLITVTTDFIKKYIHSISEGKFNLTQLEDREKEICGFCDFKSICRINELSN